MKLSTDRLMVHQPRHVIVVDTRHPDWRERLPQPMAAAIGNFGPLGEKEELFVIARDPSPTQALRHTRVSLRLLVGALWRGFCGYCRRINRAYNATNYQFRDPWMMN